MSFISQNRSSSQFCIGGKIFTLVKIEPNSVLGVEVDNYRSSGQQTECKGFDTAASTPSVLRTELRSAPISRATNAPNALYAAFLPSFSLEENAYFKIQLKPFDLFRERRDLSFMKPIPSLFIF